MPSWKIASLVNAWDAAKTRLLRRRLAVDPVGFNFFGSVSGNLGLGEAARNTLTTLRRLGYPVAVTDVDPGSRRGGKVLTHGTPGDKSADAGLHPVNLFHLNPAEALGFMWGQSGIAARDRINVCVPFWELEELPASWVEFLEAMDVVFAPTDFIAGALRAALPGTPCARLPQAVPLRLPSSPDRKRWGLPSTAVAFLATFDVSSDPARKNPAGVVSAFRAAFPERDDVRLVLKTQPIPADLLAHRSPLRTMAEDDPRISFIEEQLTFGELTNLQAAVDVYVSLHRSEGLGLGLMESLSLGVPVIATAYSGPLDFLHDGNSLLVPYTRVPIDPEIPVYRQMVGVSYWAEPDLQQAAQAMRTLADDPSLRARLGERGRADMEARRREVASGAAFTTLIDLVRNDPELWARHPDRLRQFRTLAPSRIPPPGVLRHRLAVRLKGTFRTR